MTILAHKIELNPNKAQAEFLQQCAGTARFIWNRALAEWKKQYEAGENPSAYGLTAELTTAKHEDPTLGWLSDIPRAVADNAVLNLGTAFKNFFRQLKRGTRKRIPILNVKVLVKDLTPGMVVGYTLTTSESKSLNSVGLKCVRLCVLRAALFKA